MKPYLHSKSSAKKYGGKWEDYIAIHDFMDSSKSSHASVKHRAVFHSAFGCFVVEWLFGTVMVNSANRTFSPRDVAEQHIIEDLGFIPSLDDYLKNMELKQWMSGTKITKKISLTETEET